jgi:hypothetical protein
VIEAYGSTIKPIDVALHVAPAYALGKYMITARCVDRCHYYRQIIDTNYARDPVEMLNWFVKRLPYEFSRAHPWGW